MIIRLVRLSFLHEHEREFLELFEAHEDRIRYFPGCRHLQLWRHEQGDGVYFTCSHWDSAEDLDAYRKSDLFRTIWPQVKTYFREAPAAWSLSQVVQSQQ